MMDKTIDRDMWQENQEVQPDEELVEQAKSGDREAFGELVRRHRAKMYGYARSYTQESFLAEDIVQDALIRAFLHLGTLTDSRRFLPWLHRIVRNQAYTRLSKGPQKREQVFSGLQHQTMEMDETDWGDLDSILRRLGISKLQGSDTDSNPEEVLMRRELLQTIVGLLGCLSQRERRIVESHFFDHLSPQEIAGLFQMSQGNVYQILSRSRKKLIQQKTRIVVDQYVNSRKEAGTMKKVMLEKPKATQLHTWITCAMALFGVIENTGKKMSFPMVMGLSGHAFRLTVVPGNLHIAGPTMFDFTEVLQQGLRNMGFASHVINESKGTEYPAPNTNLADPALVSPNARKKRELAQTLPEALELIHRSIDRGHPVLAWDLFIPEFGLIYGYDDEKKTLYAADNCGHDATVSYEDLGRGIVEELFVLSVGEASHIEQRAMLTQALESVLNHYRVQEHSHGNAVNGLAAYAAWQEAYQQGGIEPNGNAYTTAIARDARKNAALFWTELADTWTDSAFDAIRPAMREASELYAKIAEQFAELCRLFPFPAGGEPNNPENSKQAIAILQTIEQKEQEAVVLLEQMRNALSE